MISNKKINRMQTFRPQTFRGGGFLYYSKSIEEDTSNNQQKPSFYEDHLCLVQSSKGWGDLKLSHPKMKGDNRLESFKTNSNIGNPPFVVKNFSSEIQNSISYKDLTRKDIMSLVSAKSKESIPIEENESDINSGAVSSRSSNIHIDKFYVNLLFCCFSLLTKTHFQINISIKIYMAI